MVREYLNALKTKGNFSWSDLSKLSGLPDATIRKIFSGETSDPRFETVAKLVAAMGGSMNDLVRKEHRESKEKENEITANAALKELYEARIADIKASAAERIHALNKDKKLLTAVVCILGAVLLGFLAIDLMVGNVGWIRY